MTEQLGSQAKNVRPLLLALALALACDVSGCVGRGELVGVEPDTSFARSESQQLLLGRANHGVEVWTIGGRYVRTLWKGGVFVPDVDDAMRRALVYNPYAAFTIDSDGSARPLDVPEEARFCGMSLNGFGTLVAAVYSGHLRVLSATTGQTLSDHPYPSGAMGCWVGWDTADPNVLWLMDGAFGFMRYDRQTKEVRAVEASSATTIRFPAQTQLRSAAVSAQTGETLRVKERTIEMSKDGQPARTVASARGMSQFLAGGRQLGFSSVGFVPGCRFAVFDFYGEYFLVSLSSGRVGRLPGALLFVPPDADAALRQPSP